jgi:NADPH:quinone reductase-like Zn-dependent oxidoreductase
MKALQQIAHGDPAEVVKLVDLPDPTPGAGEVIIRMEAAALHLADIKNFTGERDFQAKNLPRIPGYEGIGRIAAAGSGVTQFKIGDRVFPWWGAGTFAELVRAPADKVLPAPEGDARQLALMLVNGFTAISLLDDFVPLRRGDWLAQNGANSNCGRYIVVLARERGIRTCNIVRRAEVVDELTALGGDAVILVSEDPAVLAARVKAATGGAELKLAFDMVAGPATGRMVRCVSSGGVVVNYGFISGQPCEVHFTEVWQKNARVVGMSAGRGLAKRGMDEMRRLYAHLATMIAAGQLRAAIAGAYPLERAADAFRHALRTGVERDGKIILLPNG